MGKNNKAFVYSPNNIRRYAFSAIRQIMKDGVKDQTVAHFMREVKKGAMAEAQKDSVSYQPWKATMDEIQQMLLSSKALVGAGEKPITAGLHARGTQLISIVNNFEDLCELFLLKVLIEKMQLTPKDRVSVAHALFKEGSKKDYDELEERLDTLFTLLGDELGEGPDGIIILMKEMNASSNARVN